MRIALAILFLILTDALSAQVPKQKPFETVFPAKMWDRPHLDSTINVDRLSLESCYQLIEKMFVVDQQYRDSLHRHRVDEARSRSFMRLMAINDPVNQTILLKILNRHGWPCDDTKRKLSTKAWHIAWHARGDLDKMLTFYPYLVRANSKKCINRHQFAEFKERVEGIKKVRSQWVQVNTEARKVNISAVP
ncbi:MAG: hypothetical protein H7Z72_22560 [Bacteroidetes bacterium]|nr:hypothetical protein [Fibrella sp.]